MREQALQAIQPRRFAPRTTDSRHGQRMSPNLLLERAINVDRPRQVIVGDITFLPLQNGRWAYLATWMDLFSRKIVGWHVADSMTAELVIDSVCAHHWANHASIRERNCHRQINKIDGDKIWEYFSIFYGTASFCSAHSR